MPLVTPNSSYEFKHLKITPLHPTFGAEVEGVNFEEEISDEVFQEILAASAIYGVCVFRNTGLDDRRHVEFSRKFGQLDDIKPYLQPGRKLRYEYLELFDAGNVDENGKLLTPDHPRFHYNKGNFLFHVDSSFNPRRSSHSLLRGVILPPPHTGGNTDFADTRTAFADLPPSLQESLIQRDYVVAHSIHHSRKTADPTFFSDLDPTQFPMSKHKLIQLHQPSGRMNIYTAAHAHHIVGLPAAENEELMKTLMEHATQEKYRMSVKWENEGDLVVWDNTCVMHRSGEFKGGYVRDMRRTTVHDGSSSAWGMNKEGDRKPGFDIGSKGLTVTKSVTGEGVIV
ncbi:alpha-ketoglutarate-dependent 2,4-dichlorophenoxyacetate dioxygenase [Amylocarpus encephaloides]|uniref:Alpha-ketoglutarate-dependent 2,4-dichlorophenoxyacetate dioxygenase n=1 Tax=Amylocarpus encephaloides TaxID=45428 RepID=A0A9P8BZL9_9HELO|nr:alpha-ketoglutarate-dependent 2,4-dichlorophenoxyacetate dioxygenase [Amylocarpus encephaloides]